MTQLQNLYICVKTSSCVRRKRQKPLYYFKFSEVLIYFYTETLYIPAAQLFEQQAVLWPSPGQGSWEGREKLYNPTL